MPIKWAADSLTQIARSYLAQVIQLAIVFGFLGYFFQLFMFCGENQLSITGTAVNRGIGIKHFCIIYYLSGLQLGTVPFSQAKRDCMINTMSPNPLILLPLLKVYIFNIKAAASIHRINCIAKGSRQHCFHST